MRRSTALLLLLSACSSKGASVTLQSPPVVTIAAPANRETFAAGEEVELVVLVGDGDTAFGDLRVRVDSNLDGALATDLVPGDDGVLTLSLAPLSSGTQLIGVTAVDTDGLSGSDAVSFAVLNGGDSGGDTGPDTGSDTGDTGGDTADSGGDTSDSGADTSADTSGDTSGDSSTDTSDSAVDTSTDTALDSTDSTDSTVDSTDTSDSGGDTGPTDAPPTIEWIHPTAAELGAEGIPYELVTAVADPEDAPETLAYTVASSLDGEVCAGTAGPDGFTSCVVTLSAGEHVLTAAVVDSAGHVAEDAVTYVVLAASVIDDDSDGWSEAEGDCNDADAAVNPGATERCDGIDNDCDGYADGASAIDATSWYADGDGDTFGDAGEVTLACSAPEGTVADSTDCDDSRGDVRPGAEERCDGVDNDCDGAVDEDGVSDWYRDADGDGYGDAGDVRSACAAPDGYVADASDCNDALAAANPAAAESCDGVDDDCDGVIDEADAAGCMTYYYDGDGDSYGSTTTACLCAASGGYTATGGGDCYDANPSAVPTATGWYTTDRGDGSFDYNCDGAQTQYYTSTYGCSADIFSCSSHTDGYGDGVPGCGSTGTWYSGCSAFLWICYADNSDDVTQACR